MKLVKLECPFCGGHLEAEEGRKTVFCPYCGRKVAVEEEVTTIRIHDEAKLKEAELQERKYHDNARRKEKEAEEERFRAFRQSRGAKWLIGFLVLSVLAAFAAFSAKHPLAGLIALVQAALLALAWLIGTGTIREIRGRKVPMLGCVLLAGVLVIPYMGIFNRRVYEKYVWPQTTAASSLPHPKSPYGTILSSSEDSLRARIDQTEEAEYQAYIAACRERGYEIDVDQTGGYSAYNEEDRYLELSHDADRKEMEIRLREPKQYGTLTWPFSSLSSLLPEPKSKRGNVEYDTSEGFSIELADTPEEEFDAYVLALLNQGFDQNYERSAEQFSGKDAEGNRVIVTKGTHQTMMLELRAKQEDTPEPANDTPEPTADTPEPTADTASAPPQVTEPAEPSPETKAESGDGIRPEFRRTMEEYEAFYDEYIAFMEKYSASDNSGAMMMDYLSLMQKLSEWQAAIDRIDESELSDQELLLFNEVNLRVAGKLNAAAIRMN